MRGGLVGLLLLAACPDQNLGLGTAELEASPPLLDLGEVALGTEVTGRISLIQRYGSVKVLDVNLLPTLGSGFVYEGPAPYDLDPDDPGVDVVFRPTEQGYASTIVQVLNDSRYENVAVELRARAVAGTLVASPPVIDLGVVPVGTTASAELDLRNTGKLGLVLHDALTTRSDLSVTDVFPVALPAAGRFTVEVAYAASNIAPMQAWVSFVAGTAVVADVVLVRANDCEQGLPEAYDLDADGVTSCAGDCNDDDADIFPGQVEHPDGIDQDCDDLIDEGTIAYDDDGDGSCEGPVPCVGGARTGDCNDDNAAVHPRATELAENGIDDNCDGQVDPGSADVDGDGYGPQGGDCNDANPAVHPGVVETVDGVDQDCNGVIDDATAVSDDDGDGHCESATTCLRGALPGDCADNDAARAPGAPELPNFIDDDCNGTVDEGTPRGDDDGDGFSEVGGDCNDADPTQSPALGTCPRP